MSIGISLCCAYSFTLVTTDNMTSLKYLYQARYAFIILFWLVGGVIFISTLAAGMAFAVADQLGIYTVSESVLNFSLVILVPFAIMAGMTTCSYNFRYYEIYDEEINFPLDRNSIFGWKSTDVKVDTSNIDQLTTSLIESYLHDPAQSAKAPVPSLRKSKITVITM